MPTVALDGLTKRFGALTAVDGVTLALEPGSICGLLGPNGAGKTTTFKCLLGFVRPDAGSVSITGGPPRPAMFEEVAYVPERPVLYEWLRVEDHLRLGQRSFRRYDPARARELLGLFALDPRKKVETLSKGMHTALALVLAFAIRPRILILDEPSSGLDPIHQRNVLDLIIDAAANDATVVFSRTKSGRSNAADRVAIMHRGNWSSIARSTS